MGTVGGNLRSELARLSDTALRDALVEILRAAVAESAGRHPQEVRVDWVNPDPTPLWSALWSYVLRDLGFLLYGYDLPHCHSILELAAHLVGEVRDPPPPAAPMGELYEAGADISDFAEAPSDPPLEKPAAFLLSAPRSGSTLLCAMLGRHPRLYAASELSLIPFDSMSTRGHSINSTGQIWMRIGLFSALRDLAGLTNEEAERECRELEQQDVAVSAVYRRLQSLARDRLIVDKSPLYVGHPAWLSRIERLFTHARYIHLTRQPGAMIESFVRRRFHRAMGRGGLVWDQNPWTFAEKVWTSSNLHMLRFRERTDASRHLRVAYEDLVARPGETMARICDFLGIPFDAAMLDPYGRSGLESPRMGDPAFFTHKGIDATLASGWQHALPSYQFGPITRDVAAAVGYALQ